MSNHYEKDDDIEGVKNQGGLFLKTSQGVREVRVDGSDSLSRTSAFCEVGKNRGMESLQQGEGSRRY